MLAAPLPPAPRQPINAQERGVKHSRKPMSALFMSAVTHIDLDVGV
jgi:hypothetical protein